MLFSSLPFLFCFLPLFFLLYFVYKERETRNHMLLIFSLVFYAWGEPLYIVLMLFSIAVNYFIAKGIERAQQGGKSGRLSLAVGIALNILIIGVFKYLGFILRLVTGGEAAPFDIPLPIGISFYTFQVLSYIIDVYRKHTPAQKNILLLGTYIVSFPQLIAGPIIRYQSIAAQLTDRQETAQGFAAGLRRFIAGLAKKVLIANTVASLADGILSSPIAGHGAAGAWIAMLCYALQIYYDFSGYSDMAIGLGRMMGFHYPENFNYPYIARSVSDFWRRWHITLSSFFRDYVYIPLGGNRVTIPRWILNMLIVWMLTGLWHGADTSFVLWGLYFGVLLILERLFLGKWLTKLPVFSHIYALLAVLGGWVIFRAESAGMAMDIFRAMGGVYGPGDVSALVQTDILQLPHLIAMGIGIVCSMPISSILQKNLCQSAPGRAVADICTLAALVLCVFSLAAGSYNPFIYLIF